MRVLRCAHVSSVEFIRIDGTTPGHHRGQLTANFQSNPKVRCDQLLLRSRLTHQIRVALLGITAAGVGLTLHAASTVVFAELYWNPGAVSVCVELVLRGTAYASQAPCCKPRTVRIATAHRRRV